jgi:putative resolvase
MLSMKLSEYARKNSITYQTAWNHFKKGMIPNARQLESGTVVIDESPKHTNGITVVYSRVSSSQNRPNLKSQSERLVSFCIAKGWVVDEVVEECASGLNDNRPKLNKILIRDDVTRIVVEHKDRLSRFGFNYIKLLFKGEIVVVNETINREPELVEDLVSIITSFCARIYGNRRSKRKTEKIIKELQDHE